MASEESLEPDWEYLEWEGHNICVPNYVIVDIDHCLSHAHWRDNLIGSWDEYHSSAVHDRPIREMRELLSVLNVRWSIVAITGRPERWRSATFDWLRKHEMYVDELIMRPDDCYEKSAVIKVSQAKARFGEPLSKFVAFVIDDKDEICASFRAEGVSSLQITARSKVEEDKSSGKEN